MTDTAELFRAKFKDGDLVTIAGCNDPDGKPLVWVVKDRDGEISMSPVVDDEEDED